MQGRDSIDIWGYPDLRPNRHPCEERPKHLPGERPKSIESHPWNTGGASGEEGWSNENSATVRRIWHSVLAAERNVVEARLITVSLFELTSLQAIT